MKRRGTVLLVVVVIVMLLSLAAYNYMLSMQTEHMATIVDGERLMARQAAYSASDLLAVLLEKSRAERDALGGLRDNVQLFGGQATALSQSAELATDTAPSSMGLIAYPVQAPNGMESPGNLSMPLALAAQTARPSSSSADSAGGLASDLGTPTRYGAVNESSKLHLLKLLEGELNVPGSAVEKLMQLPGMDEATAAALLDWIDTDDQQRPNGAEATFYATLTRPLAPRNALPTDLDELLFVKGVTPQRLFGDPADLPDGMLPGALQPTLEMAGANPLPWAELLTVYSAERNETYTGQPRVFVNAKDLARLHQDLAKVISAEWATFIVLYRQFGPSKSASTRTDKTEQVTIDFAVPAQFDIESPLDLIGISVTPPKHADAGSAGTGQHDEELAVESPCPDELTSMQTQLPALLDAITLVPETRVVGRVNINEAPPEVLSTLPGLDVEAVAAIVAARQTESVDAASRAHPVWLLTEGVVTVDTMRALLPHVTCGGDVYRADVWGRVDDTSPLFHFETVLDASDGPARSVYYRERAAARNEIQIPAAEAIAGGTLMGTDRNPSRERQQKQGAAQLSQ